MHIIIIANHQPVGLSPLTDNNSTAMLEIGGKLLIEHLLENVANISHDKITIVASRAFNAMRKHVDSGTRWGLDIDFVSSRPNEPLQSLTRRQPDMFEGNVLVLSADRIYTENLSDQDGVVQLQGESIESKINHLIDPAMELTSYEQYLDLCLAAARGDIPHLNLRGSERAPGLRTGYQSRISASSVLSGNTHIGNHCQVDKSAQLRGTVVLESSVVIDRNTKIEDSVVLANTYVGEQLNLKRCIVSGRYMIRVDESVVIELADSFMAAPLQNGIYSAHLAGPTNQLTGVLIGITTLPLMVVGVLASLWENPYEPFVKRTWVSNQPPKPGVKYRTYDTFEFNVSNEALRKLPQILDIGLGHLRWFGVSVASETELDSRTELWQMTRDKHPMGVFGIAQINSIENSEPSKRFLTDATYVSNASVRTNLGILKTGLQKLFKVNFKPVVKSQLAK